LTKTLSLILAVLLSTLGAARTARAGDATTRQAERRAALSAKVKDGIAKLGVGRDARIKVHLRDKTKVAGYVSRAGDADFTVTDLETGRNTDVTYGDVTKVKGNNLHTGWKIAIGAGILLTILFILVWTEAIGDAET
jgi:hypothetical protein